MTSISYGAKLAVYVGFAIIWSNRGHIWLCRMQSAPRQFYLPPCVIWETIHTIIECQPLVLLIAATTVLDKLLGQPSAVGQRMGKQYLLVAEGPGTSVADGRRPKCRHRAHILS